MLLGQTSVAVRSAETVNNLSTVYFTGMGLCVSGTAVAVEITVEKAATKKYKGEELND